MNKDKFKISMRLICHVCKQELFTTIRNAMEEKVRLNLIEVFQCENCNLEKEITDTDRINFLEKEFYDRKMLIHEFDGVTYREILDKKIIEKNFLKED